jgi:hypothetical protein
MEKPIAENTYNVNRVEVIDHTKGFENGGGRQYVFWEKDTHEVELVLQDGGKTLKIFISNPTP